MDLKLRTRNDPRNKYVRIVVGGGYTMPGGNELWADNWRREDPLSLDGIFTIARIEKKKGRFTKENAKIIKDTFAWFNDNIPCPTWPKWKEAGVWNQDWICWWRLSAKEVLNKLRPMIKAMREHGIVIRMLYTDRLSNIKYKDKYQVVAEIER